MFYEHKNSKLNLFSYISKKQILGCYMSHPSACSVAFSKKVQRCSEWRTAAVANSLSSP